MDEEDNYDNFPLADSLDNEIIMHRDAHFGGKFSFMIDYYEKEGKGVQNEFPIDRILFLSYIEEKGGQDIAPVLLEGKDAERIASARKAYKDLRDIYEKNTSQTSLPVLLADLILSEEEIPENEIDALVLYGKDAVPSLLDLLGSDEFSDPLFPGYGFAPELAAIVLGRIGDERAILPLFGNLGKEGFFMEENALVALKRIGQKSKEFLLKTLKSRPITKDNEYAALALNYFSEDTDVASIALKELTDPDVQKRELLATHLILSCDALKSNEEREVFKQLAQSQVFSNSLKNEMKMIIKTWKPL